MVTATQNLDEAKTLRCLIEAVAADADDAVDQLLLMMLDSLILDNEFQLGIVKDLYSDDLQRRIVLKQIFRTADKIIDALNEEFAGEVLPPGARGLVCFIHSQVLPLALIVQSIEAEHPEEAETFAFESAQYAETRAA